MSLINIVALGGVQEVGKNMYVVEVDGQMFILDAGMKFPTSEERGVDIVLPDFSYLLANQSKIKGIFLSHAHADHIGALTMILKYINVPIYGTRFTISAVKDVFTDSSMDPSRYLIKEVAFDEVLRFGKVDVKFIKVSHSVPDSSCIALKTPDGNIVYTGNYNFDQNGGENYLTDYNGLAEISKEGVLALLPESIGVLNQANRLTIQAFIQNLSRMFQNCKGRIILTMLSTNLQRIQQIIDVAKKNGKKIAISGRKTQRVLKLALALGYLNLDGADLQTLKYIDSENKNDDPNLVYIVTGERHEPYYALQRMAKGQDRIIHLEKKDTVLFIINPQLGTERIASNTMNLIYEKCDHVSVVPPELVISASSNYEEAKEMINIMKPRYLIPVVGEYRHQYTMAKLAKEIGFNPDNIIIPDAGSVISFYDKEFVSADKKVPYGDIMLDGKGLGDVSDAVIKDRDILSNEGLLMFIVNFSAKKREVLSTPELIGKGFVFSPEDKAAMIEIFNNVVASFKDNKYINWVEFKSSIKSDISSYLTKTLKASPLVIPVIISTELEDEE